MVVFLPRWSAQAGKAKENPGPDPVKIMGPKKWTIRQFIKIKGILAIMPLFRLCFKRNLTLSRLESRSLNDYKLDHNNFG